MEDIHPIKPVIHTPLFTETQIFIFWAVGALILGWILVFIGFKLWKKYMEKKAIQAEERIKVKNYRNEALKALRKLKPKIEAQEFKAFYLGVTKVIKTYLSHRYQKKITKLTTTETMCLRKFSTTMADLINQFLTKVDEAKFANENLKISCAEEVYEIARKIINCTK